ncbi:9536_t:CDS:2 [Entrophospora sp. SA101]|nr:9536_t:CDS:2 [Entrophospora sp. SA101]CAJ0918040.1 7888_t:CDS:2 [Entrophospora sp. SA101]
MVEQIVHFMHSTLDVYLGQGVTTLFPPLSDAGKDTVSFTSSQQILNMFYGASLLIIPRDFEVSKFILVLTP